MTQAGYSQRPLAAKLGIKAGMSIALLHAPEGYRQILEPLPAPLDWRSELPREAKAELDFIQYFTRERALLNADFAMLKAALRPSGMLWVSWPKRQKIATVKLPTDLDENVVRQSGLDHGLVDVKVAAIDQLWSGLKFVYRLSDRPAA
jgi:hypothetical protein